MMGGPMATKEPRRRQYRACINAVILLSSIAAAYGSTSSAHVKKKTNHDASYYRMAALHHTWHGPKHTSKRPTMKYAKDGKSSKSKASKSKAVGSYVKKRSSNDSWSKPSGKKPPSKTKGSSNGSWNNGYPGSGSGGWWSTLKRGSSKSKGNKGPPPPWWGPSGGHKRPPPPTFPPALNPSTSPTSFPSRSPTPEPTPAEPQIPTYAPTPSIPTYAPTPSIPTYAPTPSIPTYSPTPGEIEPTKNPTSMPTAPPTTAKPTPMTTTYAPTHNPTELSTTYTPTYSPTPGTPAPESSPIMAPPTTSRPTTSRPTKKPTTSAPTSSPSYMPTEEVWTWPRLLEVLYPPGDDDETRSGGGRAKRMPEVEKVEGLFGSSIAVDGRTLVVGVQGSNANTQETMGSAVVYRFDTQSKKFLQDGPAITASDGELGDDYGRAVAVSKDLILIGAQRHSSANSTGVVPNAGVVYAYRRMTSEEGVEWVETAKLYPPGQRVDARVGVLATVDGEVVPAGATENERFGVSVAIHGDVAIVGANGNDEKGENAGAAYIFTLNRGASGDENSPRPRGHGRGKRKVVDELVQPGTRIRDRWTFIQKLTSSDGEAGDNFGFSVAVHGNSAVVGAVWDENKSGSAYIYTLGEGKGQWILDTKLVAENGKPDDQFGWDLSVFEDTIAVGAYSSESVHVFVKNDRGTWSQQSRITPPDGNQNHFGRSLSLYEDWLVVSAPLDDDAGIDAGSAYIFEHTSRNDWTLQSKQVPSVEPEDFNEYGFSVAVSSDFFVMSSKYSNDIENETSSGNCYVYGTRRPDEPTVSPTISMTPTGAPTTVTPTFQPTTEIPTFTPTLSDETLQPSLNEPQPSSSERPTSPLAVETPAPSLAETTTPIPTNKNFTSTHPSLQPSASPTQGESASTKPSAEPSLDSSTASEEPSAAITSEPSSGPSVVTASLPPTISPVSEGTTTQSQSPSFATSSDSLALPSSTPSAHVPTSSKSPVSSSGEPTPFL